MHIKESANFNLNKVDLFDPFFRFVKWVFIFQVVLSELSVRVSSIKIIDFFILMIVIKKVLL